ncbi:MAG: secondary thiamine-phosphate synthase enzyme YjbQ [Spirochaetes bacterium]|nr:secondary thiamine-phosphate synthase enzyme YjbQ [Spirochaetota bacterium]
MTVIEKINLKTEGLTDIIDITSRIEAILKTNKIKDGIVNIHCAGSTGGISSIEYEPGLKKDIKDFLEKLFPYKDNYAHHNTWNDDNGAAHVRSFFIKTSLTVPFQDKELILGTWQQIVFVDFDTRPRSRTLFITLIGD